MRALLMMILFIVVVGCSSNNKEDESSKEFDAITSGQMNTQSHKNEIEDMIKQLPPPADLPFYFESSGAKFNQSLLNPLEKIASYKTVSKKAAINLGVYAVDIAYLLSYAQTQEALSYMAESRILSDHINATRAFEAQLLKEVEDHIESKDTLAIILNNAVKNVYIFLRDNDRIPTAIFVLTGGFIEGLYLSTGIINNEISSNNVDDTTIINDLTVKTVEMERQVANLINLLKSLEEDEFTDNVVARLKRVHEEYQSLEASGKAVEPADLAHLIVAVNELRSFVVQ